jgi:hypothetical protein
MFKKLTLHVGSGWMDVNDGREKEGECIYDGCFALIIVIC